MKEGLGCPVLLIVAPNHPTPAAELLKPLMEYMFADISVWPVAPRHAAAAIVFIQDQDLKNGQMQTLHTLVSQHIPILIINTSGQVSRFWVDLSARNKRVRFIAADGEAWRDICFHFLGSLRQSLEQNNFDLLATTLNERQQK